MHINSMLSLTHHVASPFKLVGLQRQSGSDPHPALAASDLRKAGSDSSWSDSDDERENSAPQAPRQYEHPSLKLTAVGRSFAFSAFK